MSQNQVADVSNINAVIGIAWSDLQRLQRFIEKQLDNHRDIAAVAANITGELDDIKQQLERAATDCRTLTAGEQNQLSLAL